MEQPPVRASGGSGAVIGLVVLLVAAAVALRWMATTLSQGTPAGGSGAPIAPGVVRPPSPQDHRRGPANAPITLVEYVDLECPYCKQFHETLLAFVNQPVLNGQVAWVYRHLPVAEVHSRAQREAEAAECAGELGGDGKFWAYVDRVFAVTPSNNGLDPAQLPAIAEQLGLDRDAFLTCLDSGNSRARIDADADEAARAGASGTPFTVVVGAGGRSQPINGVISPEELALIVAQVAQE